MRHTPLKRQKIRRAAVLRAGASVALRAAALLAFALLAWSCKEETSGPEDPPEIESISPAEGPPGTRIIITGFNFGVDPSVVTVLFGQAPAEFSSVLNRRITATVPDVPQGSAQVVVRVDDEGSDPFPFQVLRSAPRVTGLDPDPVRAGQSLTILGTELAGTMVRVTADTVTLAPTSVTNTAIQVVVPVRLATGRYPIRVETDGQVSNPFTSTVDVFTVTGTYRLDGNILLNGCPDGPPVGTQRTFNASAVDARPTVTLDLGPDGLFEGLLNANGSFEVSVTGGEKVFVGSFGPTSDGQAGLGGRIETRRSSPRCRIVEEVTGPRI